MKRSPSSLVVVWLLTACSGAASDTEPAADAAAMAFGEEIVEALWGNDNSFFSPPDSFLAAAPETWIVELSAVVDRGNSPSAEFATDLIYRFGAVSDDADRRQMIVGELFRAYEEGESQVSALAGSRLLEFGGADFSETVSEELLGYLRGNPGAREAKLMLGIVGGSEAEMVLRADLNVPDRLSSSWHTHLALARLGAPDALASVLEAARAEADMTELSGRILPDLAFTRQPDAIAYLTEMLFRDDLVQNSKAGAPGIQINRYAALQLAEALDGFPLLPLGIGYSDEEIQQARVWVNAEPDFQIRR